MTEQIEKAAAADHLPNILAGKEPVTESLLRELAQRHEEYDLTKLDTSQVTNMLGMFDSYHLFNQPIGNWDVSNVTDMNWMFSRAANFNQPIGDWDVSNVVYMEGMFRGAISFHQDISWWNISRDCDMRKIYENSPIPEEFKALLGRYEQKIADQTREAMTDNIGCISMDNNHSPSL